MVLEQEPDSCLEAKAAVYRDSSRKYFDALTSLLSDVPQEDRLAKGQGIVVSIRD